MSENNRHTGVDNKASMSENNRHTGGKKMKDLTAIFDYNQLLFLLKKYRRPRDKITELIKKQEIIRVKKGLYLNTEKLPQQNLMALANLVYGPSYLSKEYALSYHGLIPERVYEFTSMTSGKSKTFQTPVGRFSYQSVEIPYYVEAIERRENSTGSAYLIATPEKALCDLIYYKHFPKADEFKSYLSGLRIEIENLKTPIIKKLAKISKRRSLELLYEVLEGTK